MTRGSAAVETIVPNAAFPSTPLGCPKAGVFVRLNISARIVGNCDPGCGQNPASTVGHNARQVCGPRLPECKLYGKEKQKGDELVISLRHPVSRGLGAEAVKPPRVSTVYS